MIKDTTTIEPGNVVIVSSAEGRPTLWKSYRANDIDAYRFVDWSDGLAFVLEVRGVWLRVFVVRENRVGWIDRARCSEVFA